MNHVNPNSNFSEHALCCWSGGCGMVQVICNHINKMLLWWPFYLRLAQKDKHKTRYTSNFLLLETDSVAEYSQSMIIKTTNECNVKRGAKEVEGEKEADCIHWENEYNQK